MKRSACVSCLHVLIASMSFAALLRGASGHAGGSVNTTKQHKNEKRTVEANIDQGERAACYMETLYGKERADAILKNMLLRIKRKGSQPRIDGSQPRLAVDSPIVDVAESEDDEPNRLPYGFWRQFMTEELRMQFTSRKRMQLIRSLEFYLQRKDAGASTRAGMRGMRNRNSCRSQGGALNAQKVGGLAFTLLQFFVDNVQRLQSRADSTMLMKRARELKAELLLEGWSEAALPKLQGNAGVQWFRRWRQMYGIVKKVTGMKLKVAWSKVKRRVRVFLGNIFRLRAFWEICHPDTPMRFFSADQKPSWFNNAGLTGTYARSSGSQPSVREDFAKTRQRYTILTGVPSWGHDDPNVPPKVAILFKAEPGGLVIRQLRKSTRLQPWTKVQVQENGSYRSEDVVEALDWMLPNANSSAESIIVILDWYSGHLTDEVAELVRRKGHVLIFHGGGCTPFTQINDTHLHALVAKLLIQFENEWAHRERQYLLDTGRNKTPKLGREDIISIVQMVWLGVNHSRVAQKGYKQTGPTMPLRGPISPDDVFPDLLRVLEEIEPSPTPFEIGTTLRDEAVAFVKEGFDAGKWTVWADCHKLIEEHDDEDAGDVEGLEAFGVHVCETEGAENSDSDHPEDGEGGGDSDGLSAKEVVSEAPSQDSGYHDSDDDDDGGDDGPGDGGSGGGAVAAESSCAHGETGDVIKNDRSLQIAAARRLLYDEAIQQRDDLMVRHMRKKMREETQSQRDAGTEVGMLLRKRAQEQRAEEVKRRRDALEEDRLAAKDLEEAKLIRARTEQAAAETRLEALRQIIINRRDAEATYAWEVSWLPFCVKFISRGSQYEICVAILLASVRHFAMQFKMNAALHLLINQCDLGCASLAAYARCLGCVILSVLVV